MDFSSKVEIHFHQKDEASVVFETNATGEEEKFSEILTLCSLAVRQMANLGLENESANGLAEMLDVMPMYMQEYLSKENSAEAFGVHLVAYKGTRGKKRFLLDLKYTSDNFLFHMSAKGFGLFARGVDYYAPHSVLLFWLYLAKKRIADRDYTKALTFAVSTCGKEFRSKRILSDGGTLSASTQLEIAYKATLRELPIESEATGSKE